MGEQLKQELHNKLSNDEDEPSVQDKGGNIDAAAEEDAVCLSLTESVYCEVLFAWVNYKYGRIFKSMTALVLCLIIQTCMACVMLPAFVQDDIKSKVQSENYDGQNRFKVWASDPDAGAEETENKTWAQWVCLGDDWSWPAKEVETAETYTKTFLGTNYGMFFGTLAILLWFGFITKELQGIWSYALFTSLPCDDLCTWLRQGRADPGRDTANAKLGIVLKLNAVVVVIARLVICFHLGYYGMRFLSYTTDLKDFVLNSVALGFIYEIDEIFFSISVTSRTKVAFQGVKPFTPVGNTQAMRLAMLTDFVENTLWLTMLGLTIPCIIFVLVPFSSMYKNEMYQVICPPDA